MVILRVKKKEPIYTEFNEIVEGYKANVRDSDRKVLGVISDRYKVVQKQEGKNIRKGMMDETKIYQTA